MNTDLQNNDLTPEEQRSIREKMDDARRKMEKAKKTKQKMEAVLKVIVAVKSMIPIFGAIILAFVFVIPIMSITMDLDGSDDSESIQGDMQSPNMNGNSMDITQEDWTFTKQEIIDFIENYNTGNTELKQKMLNRVDEIKHWQDEYGYSAGLLIGIAFEDGIDADDFDKFLNEMHEKAELWNEEGYTTVTEIAKDYMGDETAEDWANTELIPGMQQAAKDAEIITTGEQAIAGDGYFDTYVSKYGRTYRNYKQNMGSYSTKQWCGTSIVKNDGCSLISVVIILSGYQDREINPLEVAEQYAVRGYGMNIPGALVGNGIQCSEPLGHDVVFTSQQKKTIRNHVATGSPAIIKVIPPSQFTNSTHFMVLLDYNSETDEFYLSNPYTGNNSYGETGWVSAEKVLYYCTRFYAIK